ncbi:DUF624 domain-containing protein [Halobacillus rhizosphaerae]|uniref:YesL family protein n=1 Tax=Halobacillus rhizosphaerae TaxID=3064889 RepID=UPI00398B139E
MNQSSGLQSGMYAVSLWISRFALANLQWILFSLPIWWIVLRMLDLEQAEQWLYVLPPLLVGLPVFFFPATAALFAKARSWIIPKEEEKERSYLSYYKENYKKSFRGGVVLTLFWAVLAGDLYYFSMKSHLLMNLFFILALLLAVFTINFFSVLVHFDMNVKPLLKKAFLTTFSSPVLFGAVAISFLVILSISLYVFPLMIPIFSGIIIAFLAFSAFYRLYLKLNTENKPNSAAS